VAGAREVLASIENVEGGLADDLIAGDASPNRLSGGSADVLLGRGGDDDLIVAFGRGAVARGGAGDDRLQAFGAARLFGGPGSDRLLAVDYDAEAAEITCGSARDRATPGRGSAPLRGCERIDWYATEGVARLLARPALTARGATFRLTCRAACAGALTLRGAGGRVVARRRFRSPRFARLRVTLAVPPRVAAKLTTRSGWAGRLEVALRADGQSNPLVVRGPLHAR
jgi:hypothetical protein